MSDNVDFDSARFATASMLPVSDEEANALFFRKLTQNTARAVGGWGTVVLATTTNVMHGSTKIDFSALGFNTIPSIDAYQMRGGTEPDAMRGYIAFNATDDFRGLFCKINGGTEIQFDYYPKAFLPLVYFLPIFVLCYLIHQRMH